MTAIGADDPVAGVRKVPIWAYLVIVVVYLAIIQVGGLLLDGRADSSDDRLLTVNDVLFPMAIPIGLALIFTYGIAAALGWLRPVLHERRGVQRWIWFVPIAFIVTILVVTNYGQLADNGIAFTLILLLTTQFVGWGEEGMFRGLGVTTLRVNGLSEAKVALWSCVIFGAVHLSNVIGGGASALLQAIIVSIAGYFFYLIRRVSRSNVLNSVLHGLFDFALLTTASIIPVGQSVYPTFAVAILLYLVLGIVLIVRRHHVELPVEERTWQ